MSGGEPFVAPLANLVFQSGRWLWKAASEQQDELSWALTQVKQAHGYIETIEKDIYSISTRELAWSTEYQPLRQVIELHLMPAAGKAMEAVEALQADMELYLEPRIVKKLAERMNLQVPNVHNLYNQVIIRHKTIVELSHRALKMEECFPGLRLIESGARLMIANFSQAEREQGERDARTGAALFRQQIASITSGATVMHDLEVPDLVFIHFDVRRATLRQDAKDPQLSQRAKQAIKKERKDLKILVMCWKALQDDRRNLIVAIAGLVSKPSEQCTMEDWHTGFAGLKNYHKAAGLRGRVLNTVWIDAANSAESSPTSSVVESPATLRASTESMRDGTDIQLAPGPDQASTRSSRLESAADYPARQGMLPMRSHSPPASESRASYSPVPETLGSAHRRSEPPGPGPRVPTSYRPAHSRSDNDSDEGYDSDGGRLYASTSSRPNYGVPRAPVPSERRQAQSRPAYSEESEGDQDARLEALRRSITQDQLRRSKAKPSSLVWHSPRLQLVNGAIFNCVPETSFFTGRERSTTLKNLHLEVFKLNVVAVSPLHLSRDEFQNTFDRHARSNGWYELCEAIKDDKIAMVKDCLPEGTSAEKTTSAEGKGRTPLALAITRRKYRKHTDIVEFLISRGAQLTTWCGHGESALDHAITEADIPSIRLILDYLEGPEHPALRSRNNPLELVLTFFQDDILFTTQANDIFKRLLELRQRLSIDIEGSSRPEKDSRRLLQIASFRGQTDMMVMLLEVRVNIESKDRYGNTALFYAVVGLSRSAVKLLLDNSANETHPNAMNFCARDFAKKWLELAQASKISVLGLKLATAQWLRDFMNQTVLEDGDSRSLASSVIERKAKGIINLLSAK